MATQHTSSIRTFVRAPDFARPDEMVDWAEERGLVGIRAHVGPDGRVRGSAELLGEPVPTPGGRA